MSSTDRQGRIGIVRSVVKVKALDSRQRNNEARHEHDDRDRDPDPALARAARDRVEDEAGG